MSRPTLAELCAAIDLLVLDVDGVLTAGGITYATRGSDAEEIKSFHVRDGAALKLWHRAGKRAAIITGRSSPLVDLRAAELDITVVVQGAADKGSALDGVLSAMGVKAAATCYVGDDVPDVPPMRRVALPVAPADACADARLVARYITRAVAGHGAVREIIERILRCQAKWPEVQG